MKLHFLGTGTSFGIPVIGCGCATCRSTDPRDWRFRHAALLESGERRLLIDAPPELRLQLLRLQLDHLDGVWFTHHHADHTHGLDDLRVFSMRTARPLAIHGSEDCIEVLADRFAYVFDQLGSQVDGTSRPEGELNVLTPYEEVEIGGFRMIPLPVLHGSIEVYGFRIGDLGYITDAKYIPDRTLEMLMGVRTLVLNALWFGNAHPTHFNVEEAVQMAQRIGAERTYLTHISHRASHADLEERLPSGIQPAYDGLVVEVAAS